MIPAHPLQRCGAGNTQLLTDRQRKRYILSEVKIRLRPVRKDLYEAGAQLGRPARQYRRLRLRRFSGQQHSAARHSIGKRLRDLRQRIAHDIRVVAAHVRDHADVRIQDPMLRCVLQFRQNSHTLDHEYVRVLRCRASQDRDLFPDICPSSAEDRFLPSFYVDRHRIGPGRLAENAQSAGTESRFDHPADRGFAARAVHVHHMSDRSAVKPRPPALPHKKEQPQRCENSNDCRYKHHRLLLLSHLIIGSEHQARSSPLDPITFLYQ